MTECWNVGEPWSLKIFPDLSLKEKQGNIYPSFALKMPYKDKFCPNLP